jgi:hypothetical protein
MTMIYILNGKLRFVPSCGVQSDGYPQFCTQKCTTFVLKSVRSIARRNTQTMHETTHQTMCKPIHKPKRKPIADFARHSAQDLTQMNHQ